METYPPPIQYQKNESYQECLNILSYLYSLYFGNILGGLFEYLLLNSLEVGNVVGIAGRTNNVLRISVRKRHFKILSTFAALLGYRKGKIIFDVHKEGGAAAHSDIVLPIVPDDLSLLASGIRACSAGEILEVPEA